MYMPAHHRFIGGVVELVGVLCVAICYFSSSLDTSHFSGLGSLIVKACVARLAVGVVGLDVGINDLRSIPWSVDRCR
jgi:hypothetical protein